MPNYKDRQISLYFEQAEKWKNLYFDLHKKYEKLIKEKDLEQDSQEYLDLKKGDNNERMVKGYNRD